MELLGGIEMSELNSLQELSKLYAKPKTYKIPEHPKEGETQATIKMMPLGLDSMGLMTLTKGASLEETAKTAKLIFAESLQIDEDAAGKLVFKHIEDLMKALIDVNELSDTDVKKNNMKDFLKLKREQIAKKKEEENGTPSTEE